MNEEELLERVKEAQKHGVEVEVDTYVPMPPISEVKGVFVPLTKFGFPPPPVREQDDFWAQFPRRPKGQKRNWTLWCPFCKRRYSKNRGVRHRTVEGREILLCPHCIKGTPPRNIHIIFIKSEPTNGGETAK